MMNKSIQLEEIFSQAMQLPDDEQRRKYVEHACGGEAQLAQHVFALLKAARESGSFLESPVRRSDSANDSAQPTVHWERPSRDSEFPFLSAPIAAGDLGSLGPYRILSRVGRGGMGIVFRAFDPKLHRVVAVKVLAPEIAIDPMARKRFEREARSAAAVSHPHVVVIHAVDETHNPPYLVMEFIQGKTLADKLASQGALSVKEILRIGGQVAEGLSAAHQQGLVHRDVKPANILLENGVERAKVTDFGLAKEVDDMAMTRTGDLSGTPQYMSPEQASGGLIDHRTDLYSLGTVLYAMCTGKPPFRADNPLALLKRVCEDVPRPIQQINPEIPEWLSAIVERLLAKSPEDRYQNSAEVSALIQKHLAEIQAGRQTVDPPPSLTESKSPKTNRQPGKTALLGLFLVVLLSMVAWKLIPWKSDQNPKTIATYTQPAPDKPATSIHGQTLIPIEAENLSSTQKPDGVKFAINGNEEMLWKFARATGWNLGSNRDGIWTLGSVRLDPDNRRRFLTEPTGNELFCEKIADDIYTQKTYGDVRVELEIKIPEGSNSGVFLMGEYEVNIKDNDNSGEIVKGPQPRILVRKPAGEWQSFDITFRAPRFHPGGRKITDAGFVQVLYNGVVIHENVNLKDVTTDPSMLTGHESPQGPLLLQGSFGPVAFRNIRITPLTINADRTVAE